MLLILLSIVEVVLCMDATTMELVTPLKQYGEACGYESCPKPYEGKLNVHIVPHTHAELGYSKTFYQHYTGYDDFYDKSNINMKRILDFTISELWAKDYRTFTLSDLPYFYHWWANRDQTVRRMVYQLVRQGRLHLVGGGWSMVDEASASYHAIIDMFTYALRKINATLGPCARPLVSWQADSFAHSREVASLAAQCGMDGHFISPMSLEDELRRMREKELEMLWRGSDDLGAETDIFTHKLFDGYWSPPGFCFGGLCSDPLLVFSNAVPKDTVERADVFIESMQQRQGPQYATNHVMVIMGKRFGYYDANIWYSNIDRLVEAVNVRSRGEIRLFYSSPACYLKAVHDANPELPTKQDDFVPIAYDKNTHFSGQFTSRPTIKFMAREGHVYLQMSKQLQVLARLPPNSKTFEEFNWIMGVFQDHTVLSGAMRSYVKDYYTEKMYVAVQRSTLLLRQAFNKLRKNSANTMYYRCSFNISHCPITNGRSFYLVIYNPLAWPVSLPVRLPIASSQAYYTVVKPNLEQVKSVIIKIPNAVIKIPDRNKEVDHELVFIAQDVPPLGYRSYLVDKTPKTHRKRSILLINKNKNKKYLIRQATRKIDEQTLLDSEEELTYDGDDDGDDNGDDDGDDNDDADLKSKIEFGNISTNMDMNEEFDILTPRPKISVEPVTDATADNYDDDTTNTSSTTTTKATTTTTKATTTTTTTKTTTEPTRKTTTKKIIEQVYVSSKDKFISNKYVNISLDAASQVTSVTLSNKLKMALKIQMFYYASDDPHKMGRGKEKQPGASVFRPMDSKPIQIKDKITAKVLKTDIVEELHLNLANYASYALKLYEDQPVIEIDWVVGPIPVSDEIGKDVFMRYETDLVNDGVFYTDSNGRQTIKRIEFLRADYEPVRPKAVAGNIFPVTSKIYIEDEDKNIRFAVFNDRAQGGTSLHQGQIDLMVHRRILTDDSGVQTFLNDTEFGQGITVRGKHYLYIAKASHKPHKIFEKKFAKEIELGPQMLVAFFNQSRNVWTKSKNEYTGLNKKLPIGVHLLTIEEWNAGTILIRLENYLEKADTVKDGIKLVFIKDLFLNIRVKEVKETTLDGNKWLDEWVPLQWRKKNKFHDNFNDAFGFGLNSSTEQKDEGLKPIDNVNIDVGIKLTPQQIRTFVVWFDYIGI